MQAFLLEGALKNTDSVVAFCCFLLSMDKTTVPCFYYAVKFCFTDLSNKIKFAAEFKKYSLKAPVSTGA
ncbi:MAG TPA: hypothetical protein VFT06_15775, partial [Flavisolibacter sp.]|nr:hypothetical protein [Flavisolibacter sp.]